MHCINYAEREQEKQLLFKLTLQSCYCTIKSSISLLTSYILYKLVVFGLSMLNSNQANHIKPCNKLVSQSKMLTYVLATAGFKHDIVKQIKPRKIIIAS